MEGKLLLLMLCRRKIQELTPAMISLIVFFVVKRSTIELPVPRRENKKHPNGHF